MIDKLHEMRENYRKAKLDREHIDNDPMWQFGVWFEEANAAGAKEANAMTLATADAEGRPSVRVVLLKGIERGGFVFYTNYASRKGNHLQENPHAALCFFWQELERQIRIEGIVEKLPPEDSTKYFQSRPIGSQIGAWSSPQSQAIPDRNYLEQKMAEMTDKFAGPDPIPRPDHWGGYVLIPSRIEFWQGRENRLHDRFEYLREGAGEWRIFRLAP